MLFAAEGSYRQNTSLKVTGEVTGDDFLQQNNYYVARKPGLL